MIYYELTVLRVLEEVTNALIAYAREQQKRDFIAKASVAAERAEELASDQYQAGLVRVYKALGGGWSPIGPGQDQIATKIP